MLSAQCSVLISNKQLLSFPVITQSGQSLGSVSGFDLDAEALAVRNIYVKNKGIKGLFNNELKIHRAQIVEITEKKVVVLDNVVLPEKVKKSLPAGASLGASAPGL